MTQTPARRRFKHLSGNVNHFLITILIGLDTVRSGQAKRSPTFSTSWAPHDVVRSANRSSEFALNALMSWLVDALDAYAARLNRKPFLLQRESDRNSLDECGRSVGARVEALATSFGLSESVSYGLSSMAIAWRNRLVHFEAENELPDDVATLLVNSACHIQAEYQKLDISLLKEDFSKSSTPKFKEATALVRAVQHFVGEVDAQVLSTLDLETYLHQTLEDYLAPDPHLRAANIWGKSASRAMVSIRQVALNAGFGQVDVSTRPELSDEFIRDIAQLSEREAKTRYTGEVSSRPR